MTFCEDDMRRRKPMMIVILLTAAVIAGFFLWRPRQTPRPVADSGDASIVALGVRAHYLHRTRRMGEAAHTSSSSSILWTLQLQGQAHPSRGGARNRHAGAASFADTNFSKWTLARERPSPARCRRPLSTISGGPHR